MEESVAIEQMDVPELKAKLVEASRITKGQMAPMLYFLRLKLKKQGSRNGEGFGAWVEANLSWFITRRTADLWADEWGIENGLMEPRNPTSRNISKGQRAAAQIYRFSTPRPSWLNEDKEKELHSAIELIGDLRAFEIFFKAVVAEAVAVGKRKESSRVANISQKTIAAQA